GRAGAGPRRREGGQQPLERLPLVDVEQGPGGILLQRQSLHSSREESVRRRAELGRELERRDRLQVVLLKRFLDRLVEEQRRERAASRFVESSQKAEDPRRVARGRARV